MTETLLLPRILDGRELDLAVRDASLWPPALEAIRARHDLGPGIFRPADRGSFAVFFLGEDYVVKLVPRRWRPQYEADRAMLPLAFGRLGVPTPELVAAGELDDWGYLVMTKLEGRRLGDVWGDAPWPQKVDVARQIGELLASVHELPLDGAAPFALDWPAFLATQRASCAKKHAEKGALSAWTQSIDAFLEPIVARLSTPSELVPMTADVTDDHVLVKERGDRLVVTGFIDFGDSLTGDPLYDFVTPVTFLVRGSRDLLSAMFDGYGLDAASRTPELARALKAYSLLHRFSDLRRDAGKVPGAESQSNLEDVLSAIWPP